MKSIFHIIQIVIGLIYTVSFSQTLESAIAFGGRYTNFAGDIVKAPSGDIYVVGATTSITNFNPKGAPHYLEAPGGTNNANAFIARYNPNMELQWVNFLGANRWEMANKILLDDEENVYVFGYASSGGVDFDPSANDVISDLEYRQHFLVKYGNDGSYKAYNTVPEPDEISQGKSLLMDHQGDIYVFFAGLLSKYNSDLEHLWTKEMSGMPEIFNDSEIYCVRNFNVPYYLARGHKELVLERYDLTGNLIDTMLLGHTDRVIHNGMIKKTRNGELLVYGKYRGALSIYGDGDTLQVENYTTDTTGQSLGSKDFICRYDDSGSLIWAKVFKDKGPQPDILDTDQDGNIYALGDFGGYINFDPINPVIDSTTALKNFYIAKYDHEFNCISKHIFGEETYVFGFKLYDNNTLICGSFVKPKGIHLAPNEELIDSSDIGQVAYMASYSDFNITDPDVYYGGEAADNHYFTIGLESSRDGGNIHIYLNSDHKPDAETTVTVYDLRGRLLKSVQSHQTVISIDLSGYAQAPYLIHVTNSKWSATEKILTFN